MSNKMIVAALSIVIIAMAAFAAAGWLRPTTEVTREIPVEITLVEQAKKEGSITIYSPMDAPDFEKYFKPEFLRLYPWAQLNYLSIGIAETYSRALSEYKAGHVTADVIHNAISNFLVLEQEGVIVRTNVSMEGLMAYDSSQLDPDHYWHPGNMNPILIIYNTHLVNASDAPKTYQDLTDQKWKGKIAMQYPSLLDSTGAAFAQMKLNMSDGDWNAFLQGIKNNNPLLTQENSEVFQKVVSGEADIGLGFLNDYLEGLKTSLPVGAVWTSPTYTPAFPFAATANAPHPYMARLFLEWFASASGQSCLAKSGRTPPNTFVAASTILAGVLPPGTTLQTINNVDFFMNSSAWVTKYQSFGL